MDASSPDVSWNLDPVLRYCGPGAVSFCQRLRVQDITQFRLPVARPDAPIYLIDVIKINSRRRRSVMAVGRQVDDANYPSRGLPCSPEHCGEKVICEEPVGEVVGLVDQDLSDWVFMIETTSDRYRRRS